MNLNFTIQSTAVSILLAISSSAVSAAASSESKLMEKMLGRQESQSESQLEERARLTSVRHSTSVYLFTSAIHKHAKNDFAGAIRDYTDALKWEDQDPPVHWYLGKAYEATGQPEKAKKQFAIEQQMKQRQQAGHARVTQIQVRVGDFGSAKRYYVPGEGVTNQIDPSSRRDAR